MRAIKATSTWHYRGTAVLATASPVKTQDLPCHLRSASQSARGSSQAAASCCHPYQVWCFRSSKPRFVAVQAAPHSRVAALQPAMSNNTSSVFKSADDCCSSCAGSLRMLGGPRQPSCSCTCNWLTAYTSQPTQSSGRLCTSTQTAAK